MNGLFELTEVEIRMGFAASCVEALAQKVGAPIKKCIANVFVLPPPFS